jgi:hypothetical protein
MTIPIGLAKAEGYDTQGAWQHAQFGWSARGVLPNHGMRSMQIRDFSGCAARD